MGEIVYRGKPKDKDYKLFNNWKEHSKDGFVCGSLLTTKDTYYICISVLRHCNSFINNGIVTMLEVIPETVSQYTGLTDKNGTKIFVGDIVQYLNSYVFECRAIVKFGKYTQDGSAGEYSGTDCIGFYVEVDNFSCPDWSGWDDDEDLSWHFNDYLRQQNILEVAKECEVVGNIFDDSELLEVPE